MQSERLQTIKDALMKRGRAYQDYMMNRKQKRQEITRNYKQALLTRWRAYQQKLNKEKQAEREREQYHKKVQNRMMVAYRKGQIAMAKAAKNAANQTKSAWQKTGEFIGTAIKNASGAIKSSMADAFFDIMKGTKKVTSVFQELWQNVLDAVMKELAKMAASKVFTWIVNLVTGGTGGTIISKIGSLLGFAEGGVVPGPVGQPQLAVVHGGETITPPNKNINQPINITVTGNYIDSDYSADQLGNQLVQTIKRKGGMKQ